ncbi:Holliday junction resolvase RuvX [Pseudokineococcus basanitobsidens]|uniref:Putative pre-16S rRNA nuclease n=1 Tax=Pseudokineococcus basanitobsidens TaxID=1926649 RepID=A0ABU8RHV1_9ACTN
MPSGEPAAAPAAPVEDAPAGAARAGSRLDGAGPVGDGEVPARGPFRRGVRLGVDVGSVRVGLAACDPDGLLATAVATLRRDDPPRPPGRRRRRFEEGRDADAVPADVARVADEVVTRGAVEVVVGLPRSLSGQEGRAAGLARAYADRLAAAVAPVPVRLVDERLSTAGAHRSLSEGGTSSRRHRSVVDQVAAAWILQTALDLERSSGRPVGPQVRVTSVDPPGGGGTVHGGPAGAGQGQGTGQDQHDQREHDEQHDDEVGGRTGAPRTGEDAERRAQGPSAEEDASVSTGPTALGPRPSGGPRPTPRPGPRGDAPGTPRRAVRPGDDGGGR